jgi:hypothetical protein
MEPFYAASGVGNLFAGGAFLQSKEATRRSLL